MLAAVVSLCFSLSSSLDSYHTKDSSDYDVIYWLGFAAMTLAILSRGAIYVVSRILQGHDTKLWKEDKKRPMQPMDIAVLVVLFLLTAVAAAGIVRTLVFMAIYVSECETESDAVTAAAFCYNVTLLVFFLVLFHLFFTKSRYDISDSKGSKEKVTATFAVSIFAVLFIGLEKLLEYINTKDVGLPLIRKKSCNSDANKRYWQVEKRLRPFHVQLCVVLLFFLLAKVAKSSKKSGVLHFWSTPLKTLNSLGGESKINYDSLKPFVKRFSCILLLALGATLAWSGAFISVGLKSSVNDYPGINIAENTFSSGLCFLGFGILKKISIRETKQSFDVFIAIGLIFSSCFPVVYCFLSIYAHFACLHRPNCSSAAKNGSNLSLQIAYSTSNLTEVCVQVVLAITIRKLAKDLWSLKVHSPTEQGRIYMDAMKSIYSLYVYPFIMAYMTFINFATYLIDLALSEGPISSERTAAFRAEAAIYGPYLWEFTDRMLFSVGSLFRLLSFFVFLQGTMNVMLSTFTEYWRSKDNENPNELGDQQQNDENERRSLLVNPSN